MTFTIIIPVYNDYARLNQCLAALGSQSFPKEDFEIIVVDNSESSDPNSVICRAANCRFIRETKGGSYTARNLGLQFATGDIVAFTDSDCIPDRDWLGNAYNFMRNTNCDLLGGKVDIFKDPAGSDLIYRYEKHTAFRQLRSVEKGLGVTANLFMKRSVIDVCGNFDDSLYSGADWQFTRKCVEQGFLFMYSDNVKVLHPSRRSFSSFMQKQRRLVCWGTVIAERKTGKSRFYILCSNFYNGVKNLVHVGAEMSMQDSTIVFVINLIKLFYRTYIGSLLWLRLVDPHRIRS